MTHRIMENLWQVGGMDFTDSADAAIYLIQFDNVAALIDAGTGYAHEALRYRTVSSIFEKTARVGTGFAFRGTLRRFSGKS